MAGHGVEDASWRTPDGWADAGASLAAEDLGPGTGCGGAAGALEPNWDGNGDKTVRGAGGGSLEPGCAPPVTEAVWRLSVGAGLGLHAPALVLHVAALLAAAAQVVLVAHGAETHLPPAATDELVDEDTSEPDALDTGDAGGIPAEQVVARTPVNGGPVEDVGSAK